MRGGKAGAEAALARMVRVMVLLPAAAVAVAATSAPYHPYAASVAEWDGAIVAGEGNGYHGSVNDTWLWQRVTEDGGRTWRQLEPTELDAVGNAVRRDPVPQLGCVPDRPIHCYRVVQGHLRVEQTRDGGFTWTTGWEVPDPDRERLARRYPSLGAVGDHLASRALVVQGTGRPGEHLVVVANGRDGYAVRDASGHWRRIGFGTDDYPYFSQPKPIGGGARWSEAGWALVGAVLSLAAAVEALRRRRDRSWRRPDRAGLAVLAAGLVLLVAGEWLRRAGEPFPAVLAWVAGGLAAVTGLATWLALLAAGPVLSGRQWLVLAPTAVLTGGFTALPLIVDIGPLGRHPLDGIAAVLIWVAGTVAGTTCAWALGRPAPAAERAVRGDLLA